MPNDLTEVLWCPISSTCKNKNDSNNNSNKHASGSFVFPEMCVYMHLTGKPTYLWLKTLPARQTVQPWLNSDPCGCRW